MKNHTCIDSLTTILQKNYNLRKDILNFINSFDKINYECKNRIFLEFLNSLNKKYFICEYGMYLIDRLLFQGITVSIYEVDNEISNKSLLDVKNNTSLILYDGSNNDVDVKNNKNIELNNLESKTCEDENHEIDSKSKNSLPDCKKNKIISKNLIEKEKESYNIVNSETKNIKNNMNIKKSSYKKFKNFISTTKRLITSQISLFTNTDTSFEISQNIIFKKISIPIKRNIDNNNLINEKIKLYSFIKPKHLEIKVYFKNNQNSIFSKTIISDFKEIKECKSSRYKLNLLFSIVNKIIKFTKNESLEIILPIFIFIIIKSKIQDIYKDFEDIKYFCKNLGPICRSKCRHFKNINFKIDICECYNQISNGQAQFLITFLESALFFIKTMEFDKLNISKEEFNQFLEKRNI